MKGKCDECGMNDIEITAVKKSSSDSKINLCNQCRPPDGAYAY